MCRRTVFTILLIVGGIAARAWAQNWTPSADEIAKLEASIRPGLIPKWGDGHSPSVSEYVRYYTGSTADGGDKVIRAEFVAPFRPAQTPGIHIVSSKREFPIISDGGCGIVNLVYSIKEQRIISMRCNGVA